MSPPSSRTTLDRRAQDAPATMLPEPALTFTLPSVHDGLYLDCRVHHPASLHARPGAPPWRRHAAVLAHPYAPLGGSYDDPLVGILGEVMLKAGYLLATFNFRGAGSSAGRTSWTAKAEQCDYQSVIGFLSYYIHHLDPFSDSPPSTQAASPDEPPAAPPETTPDHPILLIGGYSYGSLITAQLPPLEAVLAPFAAPASSSHHAQIRLRAASLAEQQNHILRLTRQALEEVHATHNSSMSTRGVRVGGDEGNGASSPRRSLDGHGHGHGHHGSRRSLSREVEEKLHELVAKTKSGLGAQRHHRHASSNGTLRSVPEEKTDSDRDAEQQQKPAEGHLPALPAFSIPKQAYLLISPIPGLASHLVTLRVLPHTLRRSSTEDAAEAKLARYPTLAIHGGADMFVLPYKAREWVARLGAVEASRFRGVEVPDAGHFWAEEGVLEEMLGLVGGFVREVAGEDELVEDEPVEDEPV